MNILIVGLGTIAEKHINAIRQLKKDSCIYALRHNTKADIRDGIINLYSIEDAKDITFNFAIVSNPTSEHKKTINALLVLKCPLFIEKPVSDTIEMEEIVNKIKQFNILTYIACNLRFLKSLVYVKEEIKKKRKNINEVNVYCGSYLPEWRSCEDFRKSYSAQKVMGGGVQFDLIHEIDYIYWLFGKPHNVRKTLKNNSSLRIDAMDYGNYCLEYDNFCVGITINYFRIDYKRTMEILFHDDTWLIDLEKNSIYSGKNEIYRSPQKINDTYFEQMRYFYQLVQTKTNSSFNSINEALEVLKISI